jgi:hypothetical protein
VVGRFTDLVGGERGRRVALLLPGGDARYGDGEIALVVGSRQGAAPVVFAVGQMWWSRSSSAAMRAVDRSMLVRPSLVITSAGGTAALVGDGVGVVIRSQHCGAVGVGR